MVRLIFTIAMMTAMCAGCGSAQVTTTYSSYLASALASKWMDISVDSTGTMGASDCLIALDLYTDPDSLNVGASNSQALARLQSQLALGSRDLIYYDLAQRQFGTLRDRLAEAVRKPTATSDKAA